MNSRFPLSVSLLTLIVGLSMCFSVSPASAQSQNLPKRILGDYGYWSQNDNPPYSSAQIPFNEVTHINHAGVSFAADGTLSVPTGFLEPELLTRAHAAGVKVLLELGGDFNGLETSGALATFVSNLGAFATEYGYDGFDLDWEYPGTTADRIFFDQMTAALRTAYPNYLLSIYVAPWGGYGYDLVRLQKSVDWFNILMFDCAGPWTSVGQLNSAIFWNWHDPAPDECQPGGSAQGAADIMLAQVPPQQINMGMPFYGYYYTNINAEFALCPNAATTLDGECDYTVETLNYGTAIKRRINKEGWQSYRDPLAFVPYLLMADGSNGYITYDDSFSTYYRTVYSDWQLGLGGTWMWSIDADYDGHSQDLLTAMYQGAMTGAGKK
jgi:chitinase